MSLIRKNKIVLQRVAGKDASKQFWKYHNDSILKKYKKQLQVGSLDTKQKEAAPRKPLPPAQKSNETVKPVAESGTASVAPTAQPSEAQEQFGDMVPYADPSWYQTVR